MKREPTVESWHNRRSFHTRSQPGSRKWTQSDVRFPNVVDATRKGISMKESTKAAAIYLKIRSKSLPKCDVMQTTQAKEKTPCKSQGKLLRNLQQDISEVNAVRGTERPRTKKCPQEMSTEFVTERRKTVGRCVREANIVTETAETFPGSAKSVGREVNGKVSSVVLARQQQRDSSNHLPPLDISRVDTQKGNSTYSRLLALVQERRQFDLHRLRMRLDWRRLLEAREGFHPNNARKIPTAGEVALLMSKTWGTKNSAPICHKIIHAKHAGIDAGRGEATRENTGNHPLENTHHLSSTGSRVNDYSKSSPTPPSTRWSYATCTCLAPPVTPSSPTSTPTRQWRPVIGRQSALEEKVETDNARLQLYKDEGIGTPSSEDSIDDFSHFL